MASRPLPRLLASSPSPSLSSYTRTASHAQPPSLSPSLAISAVGFQDRHRSQSQRRIQRHYPSYSQVDPRLSRQLIRGVSAPIAQTLLVARSNKIRSPLSLSLSHSHRPGLFFSTATSHLQSRRSTTMAVGTVLITGYGPSSIFCSALRCSASPANVRTYRPSLPHAAFSRIDCADLR